MTVTIVGAVAALAGVYLGSLLNRDAEYRRWFRTECHAACAQLLAAAEAARGRWRRRLEVETTLDMQLPELTKQRLYSESAQPPESTQVSGASSVEAMATGDPALTPEALGLTRAKILKRIGFNLASRLQVEGDLADRLMAAREEVRVLCPEPVALASMPLVNAAIELGNADSIEEWDDHIEDYRRMRLEFITQVRTFLHPESLRRRIMRFFYPWRY